jgi:hypothetical protein
MRGMDSERIDSVTQHPPRTSTLLLLSLRLCSMHSAVEHPYMCLLLFIRLVGRFNGNTDKTLCWSPVLPLAPQWGGLLCSEEVRCRICTDTNKRWTSFESRLAWWLRSVRRSESEQVMLENEDDAACAA